MAVRRSEAKAEERSPFWCANCGCALPTCVHRTRYPEGSRSLALIIIDDDRQEFLGGGANGAARARRLTRNLLKTQRSVTQLPISLLIGSSPPTNPAQKLHQFLSSMPTAQR